MQADTTHTRHGLLLVVASASVTRADRSHLDHGWHSRRVGLRRDRRWSERPGDAARVCRSRQGGRRTHVGRVEMLACARWGDRMRVVAAIEDPVRHPAVGGARQPVLRDRWPEDMAGEAPGGDPGPPPLAARAGIVEHRVRLEPARRGSRQRGWATERPATTFKTCHRLFAVQ